MSKHYILIEKDPGILLEQLESVLSIGKAIAIRCISWYFPYDTIMLRYVSFNIYYKLIVFQSKLRNFPFHFTIMAKNS